MTNEEVNEYIFANIVHEHAQGAWRRRVERLEQEGNKKDLTNTPLTDVDIKEAMDLLHWYRDQGLKYLKQPSNG